MKQIKKEEELVGKTIAQVIMPKEHYDEVWIKFTDRSFVVFDVNDISSGYESSKYLMTIETMDQDHTNEEFVQLGLISPQEYTKALEERERRYEENCAEREREENAWREARDKELLKNLQKKYPNLDKDD